MKALKGTAAIRQVLRLVWSEATRFVRVRLAVVVLLVVVASVLTALGPVALQRVIDGFRDQRPGQTSLSVLLLGAYVLSLFAARVIAELRGLIHARAERRMFRSLSERLFRHLMQLPLQFHLDRQTGSIAQALENGLVGYQIVLHHLAFTFLPVVAEVGTIVIVLARLAEPVFLALFFGALLCYSAAFAYAANAVAKAASTAAAAHTEASGVMVDGLLNYETVKYFGAESLVQERVSEALSRTESEWVGFYRHSASNGLVVASIFALFLGATVLFAASEVQGGRMTVGMFVLVNAYMLQLTKPVEMLGYAMQAASQGTAMLERMLALFLESPEHQGGWVHLGGPGQLELQDLCVSYGPDRPVLKGVSFRVPAGKTLGVVGASGSGKSTLVRLLVRLIEPDSGRILLDGVPISDISLTTLRSAIAVVPQDTVLFADSIAYNIAFGRPCATRQEIVEAAKVAHLHDWIMSLPAQYDTNVGERGLKMSGGERQRISIARAAIKRPRIYICDEATSSLDTQTEREILRNLAEISRSSTTLMVAHRLSTVIHADEIVVLDRGVVVECGTHASLLSKNGRYAALWEAQHNGAEAA